MPFPHVYRYAGANGPKRTVPSTATGPNTPARSNVCHTYPSVPKYSAVPPTFHPLQSPTRVSLVSRLMAGRRLTLADQLPLSDICAVARTDVHTASESHNRTLIVPPRLRLGN